jgi:hypothetical protein
MTTEKKAKQLALTLVGDDQNPGPLIDVLIEMANWQMQQMMKNAKDGVITFDYYGDNDKIYGCIAHDSFSLEELGLKDGDKVKLIIIKEDEQ